MAELADARDLEFAAFRPLVPDRAFSAIPSQLREVSTQVAAEIVPSQFHPADRYRYLRRHLIRASEAVVARECRGLPDRPERFHEIAQDKRQTRLAIEAIRLLLERGYGKARDVQVAVNPATLVDLCNADLEAALRVAERLSAA